MTESVAAHQRRHGHSLDIRRRMVGRQVLDSIWSIYRNEGNHKHHCAMSPFIQKTFIVSKVCSARLPGISNLLNLQAKLATHDVFLNDSTCWRNVPAKVWDFTIGGYQVMKKWLSHREFELLGRALTPDEAREVTHTARRITALILLQPELDKNYQAVKLATAGL